MWEDVRTGKELLSGQAAGYLLEACESGYTPAVHGLPDSSRITPLQTFPAKLTVNRVTRVGLVAHGSSLTMYADGNQVGVQTSTEFSRGRTALGIVIPARPGDSGENRVAFGNVAIWRPRSTG